MKATSLGIDGGSPCKATIKRRIKNENACHNCEEKKNKEFSSSDSKWLARVRPLQVEFDSLLHS